MTTLESIATAFLLGMLTKREAFLFASESITPGTTRPDLHAGAFTAALDRVVAATGL